MGDVPDIPDACLNDDHDYGQGGRCSRCGCDRADTARGYDERRSGGSGSRLHALTNGEYKEQMEKLGSLH